MPDFILVAGPNGAGKSSFSVNFAKGARIHDADKYKVAFQNKYAGIDISDEVLHDHLAEKYQEFEKEEFSNHRSMLVETNLRDDFLILRALEMRKAGYAINMIFLALENTTISKERVWQRVNGKGHHVNIFSIEDNFEKGLYNLKRYIHVFDNILLSAPNLEQIGPGIQSPTTLLLISNGKLVYQKKYHQQWANLLVKELIEIINQRKSMIKF